MRRTILTAALLLPALASGRTIQGHAVVKVDGLTCGGCEQAVTAGLEGVDGVSRVSAVVNSDRLCLDLDTPVDDRALREAVSRRGFEVMAVAQVEACVDEEPVKRRARGLWTDTAGVDAMVVSHGEAFDIDDYIVSGKATVFHFGAHWCGPCRAAEVVLRDALETHPDAAVRAVVLEGETPKESFAHPVVSQYGIGGVPLILVVNDSGNPLYVGPDPRAAVASLVVGR